MSRSCTCYASRQFLLYVFTQARVDTEHTTRVRTRNIENMSLQNHTHGCIEHCLLTDESCDTSHVTQVM